jgi:hypothetical protein
MTTLFTEGPYIMAESCEPAMCIAIACGLRREPRLSIPDYFATPQWLDEVLGPGRCD